MRPTVLCEMPGYRNHCRRVAKFAIGSSSDRKREPWRRLGVDRGDELWDDEFDVVDDAGLGLRDVDDLRDQDHGLTQHRGVGRLFGRLGQSHPGRTQPKESATMLLTPSDACRLPSSDLARVSGMELVSSR